MIKKTMIVALVGSFLLMVSAACFAAEATKTDAKPAAKTEAKVEAKPAAKTEAKAEVKAEKTEAKKEVKAKVKTQTVVGTVEKTDAGFALKSGKKMTYTLVSKDDLTAFVGKKVKAVGTVKKGEKKGEKILEVTKIAEAKK